MISQTALCKENAENCLTALDEMFSALTKKKQLNFMGRLNTLALFLETAKKQLPSYEQQKDEQQQ